MDKTGIALCRFPASTWTLALCTMARLRAKPAVCTAARESLRARFKMEDCRFRYFRREPAGQDRPAHARRPAGTGAEQLLLDVTAEARGNPACKLHWDGPLDRRDGKLFGWSADPTGSDIFAIRIRDIAGCKLGRVVQGHRA